MFILEWRLTFLALLLLPLFVWPTKQVGKNCLILREQMDRNAEMNSTMTERFSVSGAQIVKLFGNHNEEATSFRHRAAAVRDLGIRSAMYGRAFMLSLGLVGAVGTALIYLVGGNFAINGDFSTRATSYFRSSRPSYLPAVNSLDRRSSRHHDSFSKLGHVFEVLDTPHGIKDSKDASAINEVTGEIRFESVHFSYPTAGASIGIIARRKRQRKRARQ